MLLYLVVKNHSFSDGNKRIVGVEWNYQKNLGEGQVFDVTRPISESMSTRPRRFKDVPGMQPFPAYPLKCLKQHRSFSAL